MQFDLNETQIDIKKAAKEFAEKEFDPDLALTLDKEGFFPKAIHEKACKLGFVGIEYPEEYGGQNFGLFENILVTEEFTKHDSGIGIALSLGDMGSCIILRHAHEDLKKRFLPSLAQGKSISTVSNLILNTDANIDLSKLSSGDYEIKSGKAWAINVSSANLLIIICEPPFFQDPIAFIVETGSKGIDISIPKPTMGLKMSQVREIQFNGVNVPKENVIVSEDVDTNPFKTYQNFYNIKTSAQALGIAQSALDQAIKHSKGREQFGRKIIQFQAIQFMLADLYILIEAARGLVYRAATAYDENEKKIIEYFIFRLIKHGIKNYLTNGSSLINGLNDVKNTISLFNKNLKEEIVKILLSIIETKDVDTFEHSKGVEYYSIKLAKKFNLSKDDLEDIKYASLLHDIGKISLKEQILYKPTKLREDEFEVIKKHPELGYKILSISEVLRNIANYVLLHHEWWNGMGYPFGIKGDKIPLEAQIISISDYIETFIQGRNYLERKSKQDVIKELENLRDVKFSSDLIDKAIEMLKEDD